MQKASIGTVISVKDGIVKASGLTELKAGEMVSFGGNIFPKGMALNLEKDNVGLVVLGDETLVKEGDLIYRSGRHKPMFFVRVSKSLRQKGVDASNLESLFGLGDKLEVVERYYRFSPQIDNIPKDIALRIVDLVEGELYRKEDVVVVLKSYHHFVDTLLRRRWGKY